MLAEGLTALPVDSFFLRALPLLLVFSRFEEKICMRSSSSVGMTNEGLRPETLVL